MSGNPVKVAGGRGSGSSVCDCGTGGSVSQYNFLLIDSVLLADFCAEEPFFLNERLTHGLFMQIRKVPS